jgi:hypothetical protein
MRRYERTSTLLTSNRPVEDWGKLLGDSANQSKTASFLGSWASVVTPKPANGGQGKTGQRKRPGTQCSILQPPVEASLFSYANSEDRI